MRDDLTTSSTNTREQALLLPGSRIQAAGGVLREHSLCLGWCYSRRAGIALTLNAVVIMIGSVHLGWHYALDGYVGALGTVVVWWLVGQLLKRTHAGLNVISASA